MRITNSPGVNIAGTVSPLPDPGTLPPLAKPLMGPPLFLLVKPLPKPPTNCPIAGIALIAANAVKAGKTSLADEATDINALASFRDTSAKF